MGLDRRRIRDHFQLLTASAPPFADIVATAASTGMAGNRHGFSYRLPGTSGDGRFVIGRPRRRCRDHLSARQPSLQRLGHPSPAVLFLRDGPDDSGISGV